MINLMKLKPYHKAIEETYLKGYFVNNKGEVISPFLNKSRSLYMRKDGYYSFSVKGFTIAVHALAAYQKFGHKIFEDGIQIRHKDNNSKNNSLSNILIGTASQNQMDKLPEKRRRISIIASTKIRKFNDVIVKEIKEKRHNGATYKGLMAEYNISSKGTMSYIINNEYKTKVISTSL